jgi:hypothetical protein
MRGARIVGLFMGVMGMVATPGAFGAELRWQSVPGCPERDEVVFRVERALGVALDAAPPLRFDVAVQRLAAGYGASLQVDGKTRTLNAPDCSKLADAVAVAVALAIGAHEPVANDAVTSAPVAPPSPSPPPRDVVEPDPAAAPSEGNAPVPSVSAWLLGDAGTLPSVAAGAALGAELGWRRLQLRVLALLLFEQHVDRSGQDGLPAEAGADLALFAGSLSACAAALGSFRSEGVVFLCAGPELGRLSGSGTGVSQRRSGGSLWLAPRVDVGGCWHVPGSNIDLSLSASAAAPLLRDEFVLEGAVPVHRASNVIGRLGLGVGLSLE